MPQDQAKQTNQPDRDDTAFVGELQRFTDPPGGAPLDDPEVRARQRRGRPTGRPTTALSDEKDTPQADETLQPNEGEATP
jgi:hypothetical protein